MKKLSCTLAIILFSNVSNVNAEDSLSAEAVRNTQDIASYYSRYRWTALSRFNVRRQRSQAERPIVASPVIDSDSAFFQGTGDASGGSWVQPGR
jgi:hypothetical protein